MQRSPHRFVSLVLLLSILSSLLAAAQPAHLASAATATAPLSMPALDPGPRMSPPAEAASSRIPASDVDDLMDEYEDRHTAPRQNLVMFDQARRVTYVAPDILMSGAGVRKETFVVPSGPHTSVEMDVSTTSFGNYDALVSLYVLDQAGVWRRMSYGEPVKATPNSSNSAHLHIALGSAIDRSAPLQIELRCYPYNYVVYPTRETSCSWKNITFYEAVPGWLPYNPASPTIAEPANNLIVSSVYNSTHGNISPVDGPFLVLESINTTPGDGSNKLYAIQSDLIQFPTLTGPLSFNLEWALSITGSGSTANGFELYFLPTDDFPVKLFDIDSSASTVWHNPDPGVFVLTFAANSPKWKDLSGKQGRIALQTTAGIVPRVIGIDNIEFFHNGQPLPLLPPGFPADQFVGKDDRCQSAQPQEFESDPVNTFSGSLLLQAKDLTVAVPGPQLCLRRSYVSLTATSSYPTSALGSGWRHSFAASLTFSNQTGGEKNTVIYESTSGNRLRFYVLDTTGTYDPAPGVYAGLKRSGSSTSAIYTLTTPDQNIQRFDYQGRLIEQRDAQGHVQTLVYYAESGTPGYNQLKEVRDQTTQRKLTFNYGFVGAVAGSLPRLISVQDTAGRTITYGYDSSGRLASASNLSGGSVTYGYDGSSSRLASETKQGVTQLVNTYTNGRVTHQVDATGLETSFTYTPTADGLVTTINRQQPGGTVDQVIDHYRPDGTLRFQERNGQLVKYETFNSDLTPTTVVDGNGKAALLTHDMSGDLTTLVDAAGQTRTATYDAWHRPTEIVGPDGVITKYVYDTRGNLISSTVLAPDGPQLTTLYTYTTDNRLQSEQRPDGVTTRYTYNASGQLIRSIVNELPGGYDSAQPDKHLVTDYGYDAVGRLITTTIGVGTPLQRTDTTSYNADNNVAQTIQNYQPGGYDPTQPDKHLVTQYGYDLLGRPVFVKDALGSYDVTGYTPNGLVAQTTLNCRNAQGQPVATGCALFSPAYPDRNVATRYGYDDLNRSAWITQTGILSGSFDPVTRQFSAATERTTHVEYDALSRPTTVTHNYQAGQPVYDPEMGTGLADVNLQELTYYDGAGNVIWQRDVLGRWTKTEYDALNRPLRTIANYENGNPTTISSTNTTWATASDTDLITEQQYLPNGQPRKQISNYIYGSFNLSDLTADRVTQYRYDLLGRPTTTIENVFTGAPGSTRTDINRVRTTSYDPLTGRIQGQNDLSGSWVSYRYDALSRVKETIQNCRDANGTSSPVDCSDTTMPTRRNISSKARYDALGRSVETEDALGHITRTDYDGVGRVIRATANYVANGPVNADTNVKTITTYDALGRAIGVADPAGWTTHMGYDALGRMINKTTEWGRLTRYGYDAAGTFRWTVGSDGRITLFQVDGVGRVIATIQNYDNGIVEAADGTDRDVITTSSYDPAGRQIETTDAAGRRTAFRYNLRDQLVQVIENVRNDCAAPGLAAEYKPCNVVTTYTYDRAGNRTAITDALNHTREMVYDAADRQIEERDGLGRTTQWEYNLRDQPTLKRDPRGSSYDVIYLYDELGRRHITYSTRLDALQVEEYDVLGRRVGIQDESGSTTFQYDALDRITSVQLPSGTVGYSYTPRGERSQLRYPSGATVDYTYTVDGDLASVQEGATTLASYTYTPGGSVAQVTRSNGTKTSYTYDGLHRLVDLTTKVGTQLRSQFAYTLDRSGLRTGVTEAVATTSGGVPVLQQRSVSYGYDGLQRLIEATETPGTSYRYAYDRVGNRTTVWENGVQQPTRSYDAANQVVGWSYDAAGNLLSDGTRTLTYDALNRVTHVTANGTSNSYRYNLDGVLASQFDHLTHTTTSYAQDLAAPLSQVLEQSTATSTTTYRYGHERLSSVQGSTRTWYGTDALGSVRQTLTDSGTATAAINYDPWGTPTQGTPPTFGFTGEWQAAASGLVHLRARWYLPGHATFVSRDPFAGFPTAPASLHPYLYVGNNPVNLSDPSGRCYPPFARLRAIEPMNCRNLDQAIEIAEHPNATWQHRAAANTYIVAFWGSHGGLVAGLAGAGVGYFGSVGVIAGGQAFLATHPLMSAALAVGGAIGAIAGTGYTAYQAMICGDPYAQTALANPGVYGAPLMWQELGSALVSARQGLSTIGQRATGWWRAYNLEAQKLHIVPQQFANLYSDGRLRVFHNTLNQYLDSELRLARRLGVTPIGRLGPEFDAAVESGTIKWGVTTVGELRVMPKYVGSQELKHSVLTGGEPVLAAGEAEISGAGGTYFGLEINHNSGHFLPLQESVDIGRAAFAEWGIYFP